MIANDQLYIIVDIETDGPVPGIYSMLSIGAVAHNGNEEISSFYEKLTPLPGAQQYPDTMAWWKENPDAWEEATSGAKEPSVVMREFFEWVNSLKLTPIFVASPLVFDYGFVSWYLEKFIGANPFSDYSDVQRTLDIASFSAGQLNLPLNQSRLPQLPSVFHKGMPEHSHKAIDDARGYGIALKNIVENRQ